MSNNYRKIPVVIQAIQFRGENSVEEMCVAWGKDFRDVVSYDELSNDMYIETMEGAMRASPEDWIIRGVHGEFYPCKPEIFAKTYEYVADVFSV